MGTLHAKPDRNIIRIIHEKVALQKNTLPEKKISL